MKTENEREIKKFTLGNFIESLFDKTTEIIVYDNKFLEQNDIKTIEEMIKAGLDDFLLIWFKPIVTDYKYFKDDLINAEVEKVYFLGQILVFVNYSN